MEYIEYDIQINPFSDVVRDLLTAELADLGFESFIEEGQHLVAYIASKNHQESEIKGFLSGNLIGSTFTFEIKSIPDQNWNETWEKFFFNPIVIENECVIHSTFHTDFPKVKYDIVIDPKMAFGTGHHETTSLMLAALIDLDLVGKSFLDMGCGTAVLAILAAKKGASPIVGVDNDEWAVNNAIENCDLNDAAQIQVILGDAQTKLGAFDVVFANINRNILLNDIPTYVHHLNTNGSLFVSGFYESDLPAIQEVATRSGLTFQTYHSKNQWVAAQFKK